MEQVLVRLLSTLLSLYSHDTLGPQSLLLAFCAPAMASSRVRFPPPFRER